VTVGRGQIHSANTESVTFAAGSCEVSPEFHPYPFELNESHSDKGLLYRESFSNAGSGWPNREGSRYVAGGYELSNAELSKVESTLERTNPQLGGDSFTAQRDVLVAYGPWWKDFHVSAVVDVVTTMNPISPSALHAGPLGQDSPAAGLVFRLTGDGYYAALLSGNRQRKELSVKLVKRHHGSTVETEIVPWSRIDVTQGSRSGIKLAVEAIGSQITIIVDEKEVKRIQDSSFTQGYVGFVISGAERAVFRDLIVEELR
jgi:hypothetical protein